MHTSKHIFFALTSTNDMPLLSLLILQKSKDFLKINCFDKNSRIEGVLECFEWIKNKKLIEGIK